MPRMRYMLSCTNAIVYPWDCPAFGLLYHNNIPSHLLRLGSWRTSGLHEYTLSTPCDSGTGFVSSLEARIYTGGALTNFSPVCTFTRTTREALQEIQILKACFTICSTCSTNQDCYYYLKYPRSIVEDLCSNRLGETSLDRDYQKNFSCVDRYCRLKLQQVGQPGDCLQGCMDKVLSLPRCVYIAEDQIATCRQGRLRRVGHDEIKPDLYADRGLGRSNWDWGLWERGYRSHQGPEIACEYILWSGRPGQ